MEEIISQIVKSIIFGIASLFMILSVCELVRFDDLRSISYNELKSNGNFTLRSYLIWTLAMIAIITPIVNICTWLMLLYHNKKFLKTYKQQ